MAKPISLKKFNELHRIVNADPNISNAALGRKVGVGKDAARKWRHRTRHPDGTLSLDAAIPPFDGGGEGDPAPEILTPEMEHRLKRDNKRLRQQVNELLDDRSRDSRFLELADKVSAANVDIPKWTARKSKGRDNATAVAMLSDWHLDEVVYADQVDGCNVFNRKIAEVRCGQFFDNIDILCHKHLQGVTYDGLYLLMGGDIFCFPPDAEITTEDGCVTRIDEIEKGAAVLSTGGFGVVTAVHRNQQAAAMIRVSSIKALPLTATANHKVRVVRREAVETGWNPGGKKGRGFVVRDKSLEPSESDIRDTPLREVRPGDYLVSEYYRPTDGAEHLDIKEVTGLKVQEKEDGSLFIKVRGTNPAVTCSRYLEITPQFLRLAGLYLAEGSSARGRSGNINSCTFTFHRDETEHAEEVCAAVRDIFGYNPTVRVNEPAVSAGSRHGNTRVVHINNQIIATLLETLSGRYAEHKRIGDALWRFPGSLLPLVAGWLDGDGGYGFRTEYGPRGICGKTVSPNLANQIKTICYSEGLAVAHGRDSSGRNREANLIRFAGEYAVRIGSYMSSVDTALFVPTYEDGFWADSRYLHRVAKTEVLQDTYSAVYDISVSPAPYYTVSGLQVHNSGNIHEEIEISNESTIMDSLIHWTPHMVSGIRYLADKFGHVHIPVVVGNHGRRNRKPVAKNRAQDNFDYLFAHMLAMQLQDDDRITWQIAKAADCRFTLYDTTFLLTHGDQFRGGGGISGAATPWALGDHKKRRRMQGMGLGYDILCFGHWHTLTLGMNGLIVNGALKGFDEYAYISNFAYEPPQQALFLVQPEAGVTMRAPIHVLGDNEKY